MSKKFKAPTWEELRLAVEGGYCKVFLQKTPERYRKAIALALAVARWRPERGSSDRGYGESPLCIYDSIVNGAALSSLDCLHCPLRDEGQWCPSGTSLYSAWKRERSKPFTTCNVAAQDEAADAMYALLCKLYKREYDRC